jgi:3-deoxy-D-arabino-heptulosonate 7-phosphate (DAHP) synthase
MHDRVGIAAKQKMAGLAEGFKDTVRDWRSAFMREGLEKPHNSAGWRGEVQSPMAILRSPGSMSLPF